LQVPTHVPRRRGALVRQATKRYELLAEEARVKEKALRKI